MTSDSNPPSRRWFSHTTSTTTTTGSAVSLIWLCRPGEHLWRHLHFRGSNGTHIRQTQRCAICRKTRRLAVPREGRATICEEAA